MSGAFPALEAISCVCARTPWFMLNPRVRILTRQAPRMLIEKLCGVCSTPGWWASLSTAPCPSHGCSTRQKVLMCRVDMAATMSLNSGFKEAPPTRKPSISAHDANALAFFALAEPPYLHEASGHIAVRSTSERRHDTS